MDDGILFSELPSISTPNVSGSDEIAVLDVSDGTLKKTPIGHATSTPAFGAGSAINYGHVKLADNLNTTSQTDGLALSAHQGNVLANAIGGYEGTNVAVLAHAIDSYFMWQGTFVKATHAISIGDTIDSTNTQVTSIADAVLEASGGGPVPSLADLTDVDISSPRGGQVVTYNNINSNWENAELPVKDVQVDGTSVMDSSGVAQIQMPSVPNTLGDLSNVTISNPTNDQVLKYSTQQQGWVNGDAPGGGGSGDNDKVTQTSTTSTQIDAFYEVLFSESASDTTLTEGARKSFNFRFNPRLSSLQEGYKTSAIGLYSHAEGEYAYASGRSAHAEGGTTYQGETGTFATGECSHAEGCMTTASDEGAHAEGIETIANDEGTHAEGYQTRAVDKFAHAEGFYSTASGIGAHAEGAAAYDDYFMNQGTWARGDSSHAEGCKTTAYAFGAHAEGWSTIAYGNQSHSEGQGTSAMADFSHTEGFLNKSSGIAAHAEGGCNGYDDEPGGNVASGHSSHAEGYMTTASDLCAHSEGGYDTEDYYDPIHGTTASGINSHSEGLQTYATGYNAHAEGRGSIASGDNSHAEGYWSTAYGYASHAEGYLSSASGPGSHVEGGYYDPDSESVYDTIINIASGRNSHAEGWKTLASGYCSHAEGGCLFGVNEGTESGCLARTYIQINEGTEASGDNTHSEGLATTAFGTNSHAEGCATYAVGEASHAEGFDGMAEGTCSHVEGGYDPDDDRHGCWATEYNAHAEGLNTSAYGRNSHGEGRQCEASGYCSHAEGIATVANADATHAEGQSSSAIAYGAHAEGGYNEDLYGGYGTLASADNSHAEGCATTASGAASHSGGFATVSSNFAATAIGHYNAPMIDGGTQYDTTGTAFAIGNGIESALSNAFSVQYDGTVAAAGTITGSTTADYAEYFEWADGNAEGEDRIGHFVTFDHENKIRFATSDDDYILGVTSGAPFILGNGDCDKWNGTYVRDKFNRIVYESVPDGGYAPVINDKYDPKLPYIRRSDRPEWVPVGMLGVLRIYDDGSCESDSYATVGEEGIAVKATAKSMIKYRVLRRIDSNVIEILFR